MLLARTDATRRDATSEEDATQLNSTRDNTAIELDGSLIYIQFTAVKIVKEDSYFIDLYL